MDKWIPSNRSTEYAVRTIARLHRLHINKATLLIVFVHAWYKLVYNKPFCFARVTLYYSSNIVIYKDVYQIIWILTNVPILKNIIAILSFDTFWNVCSIAISSSHVVTAFLEHSVRIHLPQWIRNLHFEWYVYNYCEI